MAEWLAAYSVGNAWAYAQQYREETEPISVEEIMRHTNPLRFNREQARGTLRLLHYNGATNAGRELPLAGYYEALAQLLALALDRVTSDLDNLRNAG